MNASADAVGGPALDAAQPEHRPERVFGEPVPRRPGTGTRRRGARPSRRPRPRTAGHTGWPARGRRPTSGPRTRGSSPGGTPAAMSSATSRWSWWASSRRGPGSGPGPTSAWAAIASFGLGAEERQEAVAEVAGHRCVDLAAPSRRRCALARASAARRRVRGREHEPGDGRRRGARRRGARIVPPAPISASSACALATRIRGPRSTGRPRRSVSGSHDGPRPRDSASAVASTRVDRSQATHGACPATASAWRCSRSRSVSSGPQNPSYRVARRRPASISRANGASTSSSPGSMTSKISRRSMK